MIYCPHVIHPPVWTAYLVPDPRKRKITRRSQFIAGMRDTIPMVIGATPFGLLFGTLAVTQAGLSVWGAMGFSLFVFAGSAQFVAVGLLSQGAGLAVLILTTFIVNVRHALYGASLAPYMKHLSQHWLLPLGFWLTDETYATVIGKWNDPDDPPPYREWYHLGSSVLMYVNWNTWTAIGIVAGSQFSNAAAWGLDFAMVVTFLGIIVPMIVNRPMLVCAIVAGLVGVLANGLTHNLGLMVAALAGIAAGFLVETLTETPQPTDMVPGEPADA
jgi:4-azaleucine resistance transporter AzlC